MSALIYRLLNHIQPAIPEFMKIGLLYPRSNAHPEMDVDFVDGIKTCLKQQIEKQEVQIVLESVGLGGAEKEVYEKVERLVRFEKADVIVAFIDLRVLPVLEPLIFASDKLMIVVNPGANYPLNWVAQPNIIHLNLQHAFLSWMTGAEAVSGNNQAAFTTTFYDCGYLHGSAMLKSFMAKGGQPMHNYVNNQAYNESFEINSLLSFLEQDKQTDKLLCVFDSLPASLFYSRLQDNGTAKDLELFVSPMMLQDKAVNGLADNKPFSVAGYLPWHQSDTREANLYFRSRFEAEAKRESSIFALLGWEAALVLKAILEQGTGNSAEAITGYLTETGIDTPRGLIKLDEETHHFIAPVIKCHIAKGANKVNMEWQEIQEGLWREFTALRNEGLSSGWTNTYLCY